MGEGLGAKLRHGPEVVASFPFRVAVERVYYFHMVVVVGNGSTLFVFPNQRQLTSTFQIFASVAHPFSHFSGEAWE